MEDSEDLDQSTVPLLCYAWGSTLVKVFRIVPEFRILRLTFHRKSA